MNKLNNPALQQFIESFEREALLKGSFRNKLERSQLFFLERVWGPAFGDNFDGLKAEHPFLDHKGGQRFCDFVYVKNGMKLVIEIDGFTTHARDISPAEFQDHLSRQNDLVLSGWLVLRFSAWQVEHQPQQCIVKVKQAIGHWWSLTYQRDLKQTTNIWEIRKQWIIQMALRQQGKIRPGDVAQEFQISNRTAVDWLHRLETAKLLQRLPAKHRVTTYVLADYVAST
ncbi:DUF559 domain-containing protein [Paenibacillus sp. JDR-2]|uniref:DUF559 domain-containing protein n=1 Tax=Paenibacillus sp. (strain JDR-2) TaxID=324057 RepID=UPI000166AFB6|nr:DUF559 domain-containing protein [Paenibacillus sp. JDR-2]ACS99557.1 hypothetical protein Pjdr2_0878 [Paenibacillus sp. JDR-2]